jgi:hypothetical protein
VKKRDTFEAPLDFARLREAASPYPKKKWDHQSIFLSPLHLHWPYSDKTIYEGGLYGTVDLKKIPRRLKSSRLSRDQLIAAIFSEVGQAMYYPTIYHPEQGFEHQAIEAFSMWHLIHSGWSMWQDPEKIPKPWKKTALADAKRSNAESRKRFKHNPGVHWMGKDDVQGLADHYVDYWPKYGRHVVLNPPITQMKRAELEAIYVIVCDSFENQC